MNIFDIIIGLLGLTTLIHILLLNEKAKKCLCKAHARFLHVINTVDDNNKTRDDVYFFEYEYYDRKFNAKFTKNEIKILKETPIKNKYYEIWINPEKPNICFFDKNVYKTNKLKLIFSIILIVLFIVKFLYLL